MTFEEILDQAVAMLQRRGRVAYRTLKRQFTLDDDALEDLKTESVFKNFVTREELGVTSGDEPPITIPNRSHGP
jgi:hypothetical protein